MEFEKVVVGAVGCGGRGQGGKLLAGGGSWEAAELREAAAVVNPVAKKNGGGAEAEGN